MSRHYLCGPPAEELQSWPSELMLKRGHNGDVNMTNLNDTDEAVGFVGAVSQDIRLKCL